MSNDITPCDTKVLYDTHFEAELAVARHAVPMEVYPCGKHFHLTHADKRKRLGHGKVTRFSRCPHCKQIYNRKSWRQSNKHFGKKCLDTTDPPVTQANA